MRQLLWVVAIGCGPGEPAPGKGSSTSAPTSVPTPPPTTPPPTTPTDTCAEDPALTVLSVVPTAGLVPTQLEVEVALSASAAVAVTCAADDDPDERFFAESTVAGTEHTVRLSGLVPRRSWTCAVAPTCPTQAGPAATFPWVTDLPPDDLRMLDIADDPTLGRSGSWLVAAYTLNAFGDRTWLVVWGPDGTVRWWYPLPTGVGMWVEAVVDLDTRQIVWGGGMHPEGRIRAVDLWDGETWAFAPPGWEQEEFHHDGKQLADGRMLTLEIRENAVGGASWDGFGLRVVDPTDGSVDWEFDSQVLVDAGDLPPGGVFFTDPWHANWVDYKETPTGPMAYVSLCFLSQVLAIDATTGELAWQFGADLGWTITDAAGAPLANDWFPQCQHGLEVDGDVFLVYDNGQTRNQSMAQEWVIDGENRSAQLLWSWTEPGWSEDYIGDIDWLPADDRVLVTEAAQFGTSVVVEVDRPTGQVASRMTLTEGYLYRSEQYEGCDLFDSVRACAPLAQRYAEVEALLR